MTSAPGHAPPLDTAAAQRPGGSGTLEVEGGSACVAAASAPLEAPQRGASMADTQPLLAGEGSSLPRAGGGGMKQSYSCVAVQELTSRVGQRWAGTFFAVAPLVLGLLLGLLLPSSNPLPPPFNRLSTVIGWVGAASAGRPAARPARCGACG